MGDLYNLKKGLVKGSDLDTDLVKGETTGTATINVATGLTSIDSFNLTPVAVQAADINDAPVVTGSVSGGTLTIRRWKHTSTSNPTLVAATVAGTVQYQAFGS